MDDNDACRSWPAPSLFWRQHRECGLQPEEETTGVLRQRSKAHRTVYLRLAKTQQETCLTEVMEATWVPVCTLPLLGSESPPCHCKLPTPQLQIPLLRCGGAPTGFEGLLEGLTAQLMPLITELVKKAVQSALAGQIPAAARTGSDGTRDPDPGEPRAKRHKGAGKDHKRKQPETQNPDSGRGRGTTPAVTPPRKGKGAGTNPAASSHLAASADTTADEWQQVSRRETEPFELRAQDWDAPIVSHASVGKKLDELKDDATLEAVVLAPKAELEKVATILRGTAKPHRVMLIELCKDGPTRIPGRVGNMLRFRQAKAAQIHSAGKAAVGYAGHKATAVKVAPVETCAISIRIPEVYLSAEKWKSFRTNPTRMIAKWAADQKVLLSDTWSWLEESHGRSGRQLFGKARIPKKDLTSLLAASSREGREAVASQIQWLAKSNEEPASAYHERGLRMSPLLGLVAQGGRIGARTIRDPKQATARIWNFPHVPGDWGPEEVKAVLAQAFDSVTLIHNRRTGREFLYRFRGTHRFGDKDDGEMTLWAQVAPHRPQGNKQHFLRPAPVPLLPAKTSPLDGKLVRVEKPAVFDADGKETSPAQNRALNQREVPAGCQIVDIDKDGSCLYRAVAQGLTWLSGKKKTEYCHRDLRARANAHLRKHQAQYVEEWDGSGPALEQLAAESLTKAEGFAKYLDLTEKESAYGSVLELKALSRIYDVCLMVIPRDANFGTMVFKEAKAQKHRAIVLWYTPKHIDLVMPTKPTDHYPEALFSGSTGQVIDLRAGGRSCHPSEEEDSIASGAADAVSVADFHIPEAPPVPDSEIRRRKDNKPDRFRTPQGPDMKYRLLFKCELCPYRTTRADANNLSAVKAHHMNTCHGGEGQLPKIASHKWFASRGKVEDFHWRCPLCRTGVKKVRDEISIKRLYQLKRQHKDQCHPEVSRSEWLTLTRAPTASSAAQKKRAWRLGKSNVAAPHHSFHHAQTCSAARSQLCRSGCSGVVVWPLSEGTASVLVVSFYGYPGDAPRTSLAFDSLMSAVATFGGPFVVLGDYNITQMEGSLAAMLATGAIRAADDTGGPQHPNTNPTNTRRIDFAVTHQNLVACHVRTFRLPAVSGHGIVRVDFPLPLLTLAQSPEFSAHLVAGHLDKAWTCLSDWAEVFLGKEGHEPAPFEASSSSSRGTPRDARASVDSIIDTLQQQHRQHCLQRWKEKTALSSDAAIEVPIAQVHPAQRVQLQGEVIRTATIPSLWQRSIIVLLDKGHSLLQSATATLYGGCPLSPFLSLTIGFLWAQHDALRRSDSFDAEARGYQISPTLQFLGVELCLDSGSQTSDQISVFPALFWAVRMDFGCELGRRLECSFGFVYAKATTPVEKHAALACGGTGWHFSTRHSLTGPVQCLCSKLWPSRAYLLWSCPNFAEEPTRLPTPVDRVEERLLGRPILEYPPAPVTGVQSLQPQVLHLLEQAAAENQLDLLFATDGSSEHGIGAFAAVCQHPRLDMAGADSSEDQTPFRMELLGILGVLEALELTAHPPRQVTILVDCESAMKAVCCPATSQYCILAAKAQRAGLLARRRGISWQLVWTPSHGKKPGWAPPLPLQAGPCRSLNQVADDCANRHRRARLQGAERVGWHQALAQASTLEKESILLSARDDKDPPHPPFSA
ncbi:OTU5 [Symbiodinium sp. KB8]|nr:OTU5 [Symbiodinium sp. KB8]